ncbi:flagellar brake protein [Dechloromonas sp. XY25]|uniref:Flagellar brake protein YcgR n=1 Tax=Dechloromonas hankyongensis TaxID=2908002 RepID=A0ABS9K6R4_9RHOO|nr:flagellar brake protein [Dechloromonas hankyongensis]MCG2578864.1 flagellar brake protein [Dechloromonas hankyongensis]
MAPDEALPRFEIDHLDEYGQCLLTDAREVEFYLGLLVKRHSIITAYLDTGERFFLTSLLAIDVADRKIMLDPAQHEENKIPVLAARTITLVTNLDRIKIQIRLAPLEKQQYQGQPLLAAPLPEALLRLQRREFFRLEPPLSAPIFCKLATHTEGSGAFRTFELPLSDISGGGVCLTATVDMAHYFERDTLFQNCRLELLGNSVILVNLRVRKAIELSERNGEHSLRVGCEFINLSGARLGQIEHYIARVERERKAMDSGLIEA